MNIRMIAASFVALLSLFTSSLLAAPPAARGPATQPDATSWISQSDSGAMVEILGIAPFPSDGTMWWKPDGTVHTDPMPERLDAAPHSTPPPDMIGYTLLLRAGQDDRQRLISPRVAPPARISYRRGLKGMPMGAEVIVFVPKAVEELDFGLGMNTGTRNEQLFEVRDAALLAPHTHDFGNRGVLRASAVTDAPGGRSVVWVESPLPGTLLANQYTSFGCFGPTGNRIFAQQRPKEVTAEGATRLTYDLPVPPKEVGRIVFTAQPYEYAEFSGLSLRPARPTNVKVSRMEPSDATRQPQPAAAPATQAGGND